MHIPVDSRAKGLIFDLDGTLINSVPLHYESWRRVIEEQGHVFTRENFSRINGSTSLIFARNVISKYALEVDEEVLATQKATYYLSMLSQLQAYEPMMRLLRRTALPCILGTNEIRKVTECSLAHTGLNELFKVFVCSEDVVHPKPAPDIFLRCAEILKLEPSDCLVFEDSATGIQAARNAGMMVCDVNQYLET